MEKYININYDIAKQLINYSYIISNLYNELYKLDIEGKYASKEYIDYIGLIQYSIEKESDVYYSIPNEYLKEYFDFFKNIDELALENNTEINKILFNDNQSYITNRIISILEKEIVTTENYEEYDEENEEQINSFTNNQASEMRIGEFLEKMLTNSYSNFKSNKENDDIAEFHDTALNMSVIFIEQLKQSVTNLELKNDLTKIKYINSFSNPDFENYFLPIIFDLDLSVLNISYYKKLNSIIEQAYTNCSIQINNLLNKNTYNDPKKFIITLSLLKSYLYFLSDENIVKLINKLYTTKTKNEKIKTKIVNEMKDILNKEQR